MSNDYGNKIYLIASKFLVIIITLIEDVTGGSFYTPLPPVTLYIWLKFEEIILICFFFF